MHSTLNVGAGCIFTAVCLATLGGCASAPRAPRIVGIMTVAPATALVDDTDNKETLRMMGGLASVVGGAIAGNNMYRATAASPLGVSITYMENGQIFSSTQGGRLCEYTPGNAMIIATASSVARIHPNAACPTLAAK